MFLRSFENKVFNHVIMEGWKVLYRAGQEDNNLNGYPLQRGFPPNTHYRKNVWNRYVMNIVQTGNADYVI